MQGETPDTRKATAECVNCGEEFEYDKSRNPHEPQLCIPCEDEIEGKALANIEPPEGGWPRNSDMDRI